MLARCSSASLLGLEARPVTVEVDLAPGLPGIQLVGLPDKAIQESGAGARALRPAQQRFSRSLWCGWWSGLAPADLRKEGPGQCLRSELKVAPPPDLKQVVEQLKGRAALLRVCHAPTPLSTQNPPSIQADRAWRVGPWPWPPGWRPSPAAGRPSRLRQTHLAHQLPALLPPLSRSEALTITRIQSVAGQLEQPLPCLNTAVRAPHHSCSAAALLGGASVLSRAS